MNADVPDAIFHDELASARQRHRRSRNIDGVEQEECLWRMFGGPVARRLAQLREDDAALVGVYMGVEVACERNAGSYLDALGRAAQPSELQRHRRLTRFSPTQRLDNVDPSHFH